MMHIEKGNGIEDEGARVISRALKYNNTLSLLVMSGDEWIRREM